MRLTWKAALLLSGLVWGAAGQSPAPPAGRLAPAEPESVLFDEIPAVETAALYTQTLQEAPAGVTVITEREIRRYGYRTLAEALDNVRGFYVTGDGALSYVGVRGFNLLGDFNTRFLVLLNGHYLTDNVYGAMYLFEQDFGIDMDLIQRIEVVRGPSSALYGSNGLLATINIFTRSPADSGRARVSAEFGSFGGKKTVASVSTYLGKGANLLLSGAAFYAAGRSIDIPEYGRTNRVGAQQGYHTLAHLTWRDWSVIANFSDRKAITPQGLYGSDFGDPGTSTRDAHNFVEVSTTRSLGRASSLRWRLYYDQFRYFGRYEYTEQGDVIDERDSAMGDWLGTNLSFRTPLRRVGALTFGGQFAADVRNIQHDYVLGQEDRPLVHTSQLNRSYGLFAQQEWNVSRNWTIFGGARFDDSKDGSPFFSPRVAAIYRPAERSSYKFLYGRAFRDPSTYERYWEPSPLLEAETIQTIEFVRERNIGQRLNMSTSIYHYRLSGLIEGVPVTEDKLQYRNVRDSRATGIELEVSGRVASWLEAAGGVSVQKASYSRGGELPNSPGKLVKARAAMPLLHDRLGLAVACRYGSARRSPYGWETKGAAVADFTATTHRLHRDFDVQFGLRNLLNRKYFDPMSEEHLIEAIPQAGRSVFVKLIWLPWER